MKTNKKTKLEYLKKLEELTKDNKRLIFTNLKASQSGMSRTFNVYVQTKDSLQNVTYLVAYLTENTYTKNDKMRITGCGMDMLFKTCYELNSAYIYLNNLKYNRDLQYNGLVSTYYYLIS